MSILSQLQALFRKPAPQTNTSIYHYDAQDFRIQHAAYLAQKATDIADKPQQFEAQYGDFTAFLYKPHFDAFLKSEVMPFWKGADMDLSFFGVSHWSRKHPFNFPGPFYTGSSDTCGTGIREAPDNVANDAGYQEFIFRQPQSYQEFLRVIDAASVEVFDSYSADGNQQWTYDACRHWWRNRNELQQALSQPDAQQANNGQAQSYLAYLVGAAETDLRQYCYFLDNGHYPATDNIALPLL